MIKICISILAVYLLYYAANIVYDLFLKKEASVEQDGSEEYALSARAETYTNEVKEVSIDDVEHLNTPNSFHRKELFPEEGEDGPDESRNLDYYRMKFESEQAIDDFEADFKITEEKGEYAPKENAQSQLKKEDVALELKQQFNQFLSLAETHVQVFSERDGFKVYHSMI
jgi:hypothetical protein